MDESVGMLRAKNFQRDRLHNLNGRLFQARMWRDYLMVLHGLKRVSGKANKRWLIEPRCAEKSPGEPAQMPTYTPSHCKAPANKQCWECYQGFTSRTFKADVTKARTQLETACRETLAQPTQALAISLSAIANEYVNLINTQWREMVREPFDFPPSLHSLLGSGKVVINRRGM